MDILAEGIQRADLCLHGKFLPARFGHQCSFTLGTRGHQASTSLLHPASRRPNSNVELMSKSKSERIVL